jgi:hypothetical protein
VVAPQIHPVVLYRHGHDAEQKAAGDYRRQGVRASPGAAQRLAGGRQVLGRPAERSLQIDDHVQAEQHEPDHRSRAVKIARDLKRLSVHDPQRDAAAEEHHGRRDEQRCQ